jgi:ATP-dependent Clp protease ATP-binding subunit ClpA
MLDNYNGLLNLEAFKILKQSVKEMMKLKHPYVGSEHLLLALLKDEQISMFFEDKCKLNYTIFKDKLKEVIGVGSKPAEYQQLTPLFKRVLERVILISKEANNRQINKVDLLYSLIEEGEGVAIRILLQLNINIDELLDELDNIFTYNLVKEKKEEFKMSNKYIYDILTSFNGKDITYLKRTCVVIVNKDVFDIIQNDNFSVTNEYFNAIKNNSQCYNNVGVQNINVVVYKKENTEDVIAVKFDNSGNAIGKCYLLPDECEEVVDILKSSKVLDIDFIERHETNLNNEIFSTIAIETTIKQQESSKDFEKKADKSRKETAGKLKSIEGLININEQVQRRDSIVVGFEDELEQLIKVLLRIRKPNAAIVGQPGVGKTALVEKLALSINNKTAPKWFWDKQIIEMPMSNMVAGTKFRGEFEEKMKKVITALENSDNIILFIDEMHTLLGAGGAEGAIDASNIFKPALARGTIRVIGATTSSEYEEFTKSDPALARRFSRLDIVEPKKDQVMQILYGMRNKFEKTYDVTLSDAQLDMLYEEAKHKKGYMPDIALDTVEDWCVDKYYEFNINNTEEVN